MDSIVKIIKFSKHLKGYYFAVSSLSIAVALMGLLTPLLTGWAIDEIRLGEAASTRYLIWLAVGIFLLDVGTTLISNLAGYLGDQMGAKLGKHLSEEYYAHLLNLPQSYYDQELSGKIINRLNRSINQITGFMTMMSNNFLQFIFSTIFSLGAIAIYSWKIALLLTMLYPIYVWFTVRNSNKWQEYQGIINENKDIASGRFAEVINQIRVVKSYLQETREHKQFSKRFGVAVKTTKPQSQFWHTQDIIRRVILNIIFLGVFILIFIQAQQGQYSPGQAVALILFAMQIRIPIFTISFLVENTQRTIADSKDYFEVLDVSPQHEKSNASTKRLSLKTGKIELQDIKFSYDDGQTILKNVDLTIPNNTRVALVGESGEGKSTLTNLIMQLYQPQEGKIFIDGKNISEYSPREVRKNISTVFQDASLFSGTIRENIGYADPRAPIAKIEAAAKAANAHGFIDKMSDKYDTQIGERGLKLSGGQKQRIAIARALLKDAPILILDEATSSLDSKSEQSVQQALDVLMKDRTVIIIAHRLSTIKDVDLVVTLRGGKIDEVGSPSKLAKSNGIYGKLLKLQSGGGQLSEKELKKYQIAA